VQTRTWSAISEQLILQDDQGFGPGADDGCDPIACFFEGFAWGKLTAVPTPPPITTT
jgi:hypothetical protein